MTLFQVGLIDKTKSLNPELVQAVAAALNVQVTRDLPKFWNVHASVVYLPNPEKVPTGVWPVQLVKSLPAGEGGFHLDKRNQPYAEVIASEENDGWTIAASHETIEMLVDPYGNRLQSSTSIEVVGGRIRDGNGQFEYLVEACDPCESDDYGYSIQGVAVSDFITPNFYDLNATPGTRFSFTGAIKEPRQILPGGYVSWIDPEREEWQQLQYLDPKSPPVIQDLGPAKGNSLRAWVHAQTADARLRTPKHVSTRPSNSALFERCKEHRERLDRIAVKRAGSYPH